MQHGLALLLSKMFIDEKDSEEDRALAVYGIEVFLNEFLKCMLILVLGFLTGHFRVTALSTLFVFISRKVIRGGHFDTNLLCILYSVFSCFVLPVGLLYLRIPLVVLGVLIALIIATIPVVCSYDKTLDTRDYGRAFIDIFLFVSFLTMAYFVIGVEALGSIAAVQICIEIMCDRK